MRKLTKEYIAKTKEEMNKEIADLQFQIAKQEVEKQVKPVKDTNSVQKLKKRIAVMKTIIRQQELGIQK